MQEMLFCLFTQSTFAGRESTGRVFTVPPASGQCSPTPIDNTAQNNYVQVKQYLKSNIAQDYFFQFSPCRMYF